MEDTLVGFIGFGLIGGSIARALKSTYPDCKIIAYNYYVNKPNMSLETAKKEGTIDQITTSLSEGFDQCDIIFLCAPVLDNIKYLSELKSTIKSTCILTDVGSVKGNISAAISHLGLNKQFVGGHPMAGSEKTGYHNSSATLLENAYYVLTPEIETPASMLRTMTQLVSDIGAIPVVLPSSYHDDVVAAISHVPHILASALVNMVRENDDDNEMMKQLAAGGFRDITRIASSSSIMWQNICLTNTDSILIFLDKFVDEIKKIASALKSNEEQSILDFFEHAKEYRDQIPINSVGLINKVYEVYIDIIDETGAIATIATILASNGISIKNIGIIHNREFQDGVLRIELYDDTNAMKTVDLLRNYHYTIYER